MPWDLCLRSEIPMNTLFVSGEKLKLASCISRKKSVHIIHRGLAPLECSDLALARAGGGRDSVVPKIDFQESELQVTRVRGRKKNTHILTTLPVY